MKLRKRATSNKNDDRENGRPPRKIPKNQPMKLHRLVCPNPSCLRSFRAPKDMLSHLQQSQRGCREYFAEKTFQNLPQDDKASATMVANLATERNQNSLQDTLHQDEANSCSTDPDSPDQDPPEFDDDVIPPIDSHSEDTDTSLCNTDDDDLSEVTPLGNSPNRPNTNPTNPTTHAAKFNIAFTPTQLAETKLLKILNDCNAPHGLYNQVMHWLSFCRRIGYNFEASTEHRDTAIRRLRQWLHYDNIAPITIPVNLSFPHCDTTIPVTTFDFTQMFMSLMNDPALTGDLSLLDVPQDDPFSQYENDRLSGFNSGEWYARAYAKCIRNPREELLAPICFACDETQVSTTGNISVWPLLFSTTIFSRSLRNLPSAWRPLGYVYDTSIIESQAQKHSAKTVEKTKRLHQIFEAILSSYIACQRQGGLKQVTLNFGGHHRLMNIKVPCAFIIGDMQGGDKICGRSVYYNSDAKRICRKCNVTGDAADNPDVECRDINMTKVVKLVRKNREEVLKAYSQLNFHSAWFDVDYGGCSKGVFTAACPVEPLHALENGLISDVLTITFDILKSKKKGACAKLDELAQDMARLDRQRFFSAGSDPQMPRLIWKDGVTSITQMPARQKVGLMLTIVIIAQTEAGRELLVPALSDPRDNQSAATKRYYKMVYVFQMMLAYWSWLRQPSYWKRGDHEARSEAKAAIRRMLWELKRLWPRRMGNAWKKAKFHEPLHVPDDIERNGAPGNTHTGPSEHNHIFHVKRPVRNTQRRRAVLDGQLGRRMSETYVIDTSLQRMTFDYGSVLASPGGDHREVDGITRHASKFTFEFHRGADGRFRVSGGCTPTWLSSAAVIYRILEGQPEECHSITIYSEYRRLGELFRAHPGYRGGQPWYDWVVLRWERDPNERTRYNRSNFPSNVHYGDTPYEAKKHNYAPAKILGFIQTRSNASTLAIVQSCQYYYKRHTVFTTQWRLEDKGGANGIHVVDVDSFVRPCLMLPEVEEAGIFQEIWSPERWASEFLNEEFWQSPENRGGI